MQIFCFIESIGWIFSESIGSISRLFIENIDSFVEFYGSDISVYCQLSTLTFWYKHSSSFAIEENHFFTNTDVKMCTKLCTQLFMMRQTPSTLFGISKSMSSLANNQLVRELETARHLSRNRAMIEAKKAYYKVSIRAFRGKFKFLLKSENMNYIHFVLVTANEQPMDANIRARRLSQLQSLCLLLRHQTIHIHFQRLIL